MSLVPSSNSEEELDSLPPVKEAIQNSLHNLAITFVSNIGLDLILVMLMAFFLIVTIWTNDATVKFSQQSVLYPIGMMLFLLLTRSGLWIYRHFQGKNGVLSIQKVFAQTLRDWIPFILIDFIYENLHDLSEYFNNRDIANTLMVWDIKLFGVEPVLWSQKFFHPLLTDYMAFVYALYFILPLMIMYLLAYRNRRGPLREMILAISMTFMLGFLGYVFLPCSPPRYFIDPSLFQPTHLYGYYIYNHLQAKWDHLSAVSLGAFPSLHVGISTVALVYAYRFRNWSRFDNRLFYLYIVLIVSLWVSTVYLRHHWFIDIAAGWAIALFASYLAPGLMKSWENLRFKYGLGPSFPQ